MRARFRFALAAWLTVAGAAVGASAQVRDPAAGEALFTEGRAAAKAGNYKLACEKFYESQRLDPAIGTVFNIADCEERLGHLATAWTKYREVLQKVGPEDARHAIAKKQSEALKPRLPKLLVLGDQLPESATVKRGLVELGRASFGTALPVDPGDHEIVVSNPGHEDARFRVELKEGETTEVTLRLGKQVDSGPAEQDSSAAVTRGSDRTLGWILAGVGVAGLAVGGITGLMVLGEKSIVDENCDADKRCNQTGLDAVDSGQTLAPISTTGFIIGVLGLGVGGYFLLKPAEKPKHALVPSIGPRGGGLHFSATF